MKILFASFLSLVLLSFNESFADVLGFNGPVYAIKIYRSTSNNGGACGSVTIMMVGGKFTQVGSVTANNIAYWDSASSSWHAMGGGVNGAVHTIEAIERSGGDSQPDVYIAVIFPRQAVSRLPPLPNGVFPPPVGQRWDLE